MKAPINLESVTVAARRLSNFLATHGSALGTEDALAIARGAVALAPVSESHNALAGVLNDIPGGEALQVAAADAAIADDADNWAAWHNKSLALLRLYRGQEAAEAIEAALRLIPDKEANPYLSMQAAFVAGIRGEHEVALGYLADAVSVATRLDPSKPAEALLARRVENECCIGRFVAYAHLGQWDEAFGELANRHKTSPASNIVTQAEAGGRLWKPEAPPAFKTVIVVLEWGLGDQIQFARYVPELARRGVFENIVVACSSPLASLMRSLEGVVSVVDRDALVWADLDEAELVPALDLMADFWKRTGDPVGGSLGGRYLKAPGKATPVFEREAGKPAVSFSWQGDPRQTHDWNRRLPLADFGAWAAANRERFTFVSLQTRFAGYGEPWAGWPSDVPVHDASASIVVSDLSDVADWMEQTEVFVGQCGGLIHLAGALGKPGVVMLAASHDWRWDHEPRLYNSIEGIAQVNPGDWPSAFAQLNDAIDALGVVPPAFAFPKDDGPAVETAAELPAALVEEVLTEQPAEPEPEPEPNFAHMGDEEMAAYHYHRKRAGTTVALAPESIVVPVADPAVESPAVVQPVEVPAAAAPAEVLTEQPAEPAAISTEGEMQQ